MKTESPQPGTVLVVDDIPVNLSLLLRMLDHTGFRVLVAKDGAEALQIANDILPDLILLDVMMPGMDGFEVCQILKAQPNTAEIPIIFMTSLTSLEDKIKAFKLGASDYVTKPIQRDEVLMRVRTHLKVHQQQQELLLRNQALQAAIQRHQEIEKQLRDSEAIYRTVVDTTAEGYWLFDPQTQVIRDTNDALCAMLGYTRSEIIGKYPQDFISAEGWWPSAQSTATKAGQSSAHQQFETQLQRSNGETCHVRVSATHYDAPERQQAFAFLTDITVQKKAETELRLAATVFDTALEAIIVTDANNQIIAVNPAFTRITGYQKEEILGKNPKILSSGKQDKHFYLNLWESLNHTGRWQGEVWNYRKDQQLYAEWLSITALRDKTGKITQHVGVFRDVTERKEYEKIIQHKANHDELTGLPNRSFCIKTLRENLELAQQMQTRLALIFIDLDDFKLINDVHGHMLGDVLLKTLADRLRHCVRASDTVARLGGDEFVVVLPNAAEDTLVEEIAQRILWQLSQPVTLSLDIEIAISATLGAAFFPEDGSDVEKLLTRADKAMYYGKENGRNQFSFYQQIKNVPTAANRENPN